jgi:hypothetical protein
MQASLRRTRRTGMKGKNRAASAMLVADVKSAEELLETWTLPVFWVRQKISNGRGSVEGLCFLIWR